MLPLVSVNPLPVLGRPQSHFGGGAGASGPDVGSGGGLVPFLVSVGLARPRTVQRNDPTGISTHP
jgi:hypothetical protein